MSLATPWRANADDDACTTNNPQNRPDGSLISNSAGTIWRVEFDGYQCVKRGFYFWDDYASHQYSGWISPALASNEEITKLVDGGRACAREGTVMQSPGGQLYIIDGCLKRYIQPSGWAAFFQPCAYGAMAVSQSVIDSYASGADVTNLTHRPDGQLVKANSSSSTVYIVVGNNPANNTAFKQQFYSAQDRSSYNFQHPICVDAAIASSTYYPFASPSVIRAREGTAVQSGSTIYMADTDFGVSKLRYVPSMDSLNFYQRAQDVHALSVANYPLNPANAHPYKTLFVDRWDQSLASALNWDRWSVPSSWNSAVTSATQAWDSTPTTLTLSEQSPSSSNKIHVIVMAFSGARQNIGGYVDLKDANGNFCNDMGDCPGTTYHEADVYLNSRFSASAAVVAHELGHALTLAHDGLNPDGNGDGLPDQDGACGMSSAPFRVPATIMDYDCYVSFGVTTPANWDSCGFNHAYPSGYGNSGC